MSQTTTKRQSHGCGCGGPHGGKRSFASEDQPHEANRTGGALDILDERFARGEIDKSEYEEKKRLISDRSAAPRADNPNHGQSPAATKIEPGSAEATSAAARKSLLMIRRTARSASITL